jgi:hypothetical protein
MNPEQAQQYQDMLHTQARLLSAAEHRAATWKFIAIAIALFSLFCILDLLGCLHPVKKTSASTIQSWYELNR